MPENTENQEMNSEEVENQEVIDTTANETSVIDDSGMNGAAAEFEEFDESVKKGFPGMDKLDFIKDLQLNVYIELGQTKMKIEEILDLERGYVIELDKLASEPVDIFVNNKKIAEGEVVVIDKHFGIRITNLIDVSKRIQGV